MPLAISNILWPPDLDDAAHAAAKTAGADGIEVAPTHIAPWAELTPEKLRSFRRKLADTGLIIPSLQAILFDRPEAKLLADTAAYQIFADHIIMVAAYAADLGATKMVLGAPKNRRRTNLSVTEAMHLAAERLRPLAARVHAHGVALVLEPVPTDYGADFIHTAAEAAALVRSVNHPGLRLHLDTGALIIMQEDPATIVAQHADILAHVHVSRPALAAVTEALPLDHALATALAAARYRGWISIEISTKDNARECLQQAIAVTHAAYAPVLAR
ncbi:MAG: sugar phosphate isomerase/epimerase family protein [Alphaproteobacteria bacterium]